MSSEYIVFGSPLIGADEIDEVRKTLESGWVGSGPKTAKFEQQFAAYTGAKYAIALNSCTAGLHLSMLCADLQPGDEVITTPLTFVATANAIIHAGGVPIFVDVDRRTMNIDVDRIEGAISSKTRVILPVHLTGRPCEMDTISSIAEQFGLTVIEDAAHCIEGSYNGKKIGSISPMTCFSFYVTKNMTTVEGGMICTDNEETAKKAKILGLHGLSSDAWKRFGDKGYRHYEVVWPGFKYNMTDVMAAIGLCQLPKLDPWLRRREQIWQQYDEQFSGLPCWTPAPADIDSKHARHLYTLLLDIDSLKITRDEMIVEMHRRGIGTGVHYRSIHLHKYYKDRFSFAPDSFPNANWISDRTISLPLSPKLSDTDVEKIITAVKQLLLENQ